MSGVGYHRFVAAAMVLQSIDTLSDDDGQSILDSKKVDKSPAVPKVKAKPTAKGKSSGKAAGKASAKAKGKASAKAKGPKGKPTADKELPAETPGEDDDEAEEEDDEEEEEVIPKKRPSAASASVSTGAMKRPAAAPKKPEKEAKRVKVYKYMYQRTNTYGFKVDKKQVMTVTRLD